MQKTVTIDNNRRFIFPANQHIVYRTGKFLIIDIDNAKWIVLENNEQLTFFNLLKNKTIPEAAKDFHGSLQNAQAVIKQIIAKSFGEPYKKCVSKSALQHMHLYLTNECNLCCKHCYMHSSSKLNNELTTDEIKHLLTQFAINGGKNLNLSGGEIFLRQDLLEIIHFAFNRGLNLKLYSNGTLWTDDIISDLALMQKDKANIITVQISIDGYDENSNAKIRGVGSFQKAIHTIEKLKNANISVSLSITPMIKDDIIQNSDKYVLFMNYIKEHFNIPIFLTAELLDGRNIHLDKASSLQHIDSIIQIYEKFDNNNFYNDLPIISSSKQEELADNCMFGGLTISSDGNVHFCAVTDVAKSVCNIRNTPFDKILELQKIAIQKSSINNLLPCKNCDLKYICGGGCRIKEFPQLTTKDISNLKSDDIKPKSCSIDYKNRFYDLLIRINQKTFI